MTAASTTGPVDLTQLGVELAATIGALEPVGLTAATSDGVTTVGCDDPTVAQEALDAALVAHLPAPAPPTRVDLLQAQVDELTDLMLGGL